MGYLHLFSRHPGILSFGILLTLFSSFGQTFLISIFVPRILVDLGLGTGEFGTLYAAATVGSALCLPFFGRLLDRMHVRPYSLLVGTGLMLSCALMAVAWNVAALFVAVLGLRLTGQGLMGLTASTTMARSFTTTRGKALSISGLGYPLGEGLLPMLMVLMMSTLGWRWSWGALAGIIALVLLPLILQLVRHVPEPEEPPHEHGRGTKLDLWRDPRFWLLMPGTLVLPFVLTGLFLYQIPLAEHKGWSAQTMAAAFAGFAATRLLFSLVVGPWVDRLGAVRLFPFYLVPMTLGLVVLHCATGTWAAFAFLMLVGVSQGGAGSIMTALWTEVYGPAALGGVKSVVAMTGVLSTALSPVMIGWLLQGGVTFAVLVPGCIVLCCVGITCSFVARGRICAVGK
jgi:MFS family permease